MILSTMSTVNDTDIFNKLSITVLHLHILSYSNYIQAVKKAVIGYSNDVFGSNHSPNRKRSKRRPLSIVKLFPINTYIFSLLLLLISRPYRFALMNMSLNRGIILTATTYATTDTITFTIIGNHILMTRATL